MSSPDPPSLCRRVYEWIAREASPEVSRAFSDRVLRALAEAGHAPFAPMSAAEFAAVKDELRRAGLTPALMDRAVCEARRAEEKGLSALQWARRVQRRAVGSEVANEALRRAKRRLKKEEEGTEAEREAPPTPAETFAFLLAWKELGGTPVLAALRERRRQEAGGLPTN